ncbi:hypothetical protein MMYC01_203918 [Madurella mycetomatis]|uniref:Up-regulated in Daf-2 domain-containing protein n=1 Tax=Madurella mycetomatis TaxID=100816 RepID=A0A175WBL3_9PEZI|nr:hypothetical protein MMYC01_203918 [Madurella mycetomatis]
MATTKRTARVAIRNNQPQPILAVGVKHKYSSVYQHEGEWGIVKPGELTDKTLTVEYNTGLFTTGVDWWGVSWYSEDMKTLYYSNPQNFRGVIENIEKITTPVLVTAGWVASDLANAGATRHSLAHVATIVAGSTTAVLFNSEDTVGLKRHMLVEEDEDELTEIIINEDNTITFKSRSGISETVTATKSM